MSLDKTQSEITHPTEEEKKVIRFKIYNLWEFIYLSKKERLEEVKRTTKEIYEMDEALYIRDRKYESETKNVKVHWFYGKPTTGKTYAMDVALIDLIDEGKVKPYQIFDGNTKCPQGYYLDYAKYMRTKIVCFDMVMYEQDSYLKLRDIVKFINGSDIRVKREGKVYMQPDEIYITSWHKPEELYAKYKNRGDEAYLKLIDHIVELREFKNDYLTYKSSPGIVVPV